jgi:hypothetical protein
MVPFPSRWMSRSAFLIRILQSHPV